jgi:ketosteroid isomerase-like protein
VHPCTYSRELGTARFSANSCLSVGCRPDLPVAQIYFPIRSEPVDDRGPPYNIHHLMKTGIFLCLFLALASRSLASSKEELRQELATTERSFCAEAAHVGIADAFLAHMAENCFLPDRLGLSRSEYKKAVEAARAKAGTSYKPGPNPDVRLTWLPSKVEVSDDGTLGYTWGRYDFTSKGKDGKVVSSTGIYLTIWKRQIDGSWKFVYDGSPQIPDDPKALVEFLTRSDLPKIAY